jgi:hypothetical protein
VLRAPLPCFDVAVRTQWAVCELVESYHREHATKISGMLQDRRADWDEGVERGERCVI